MRLGNILSSETRSPLNGSKSRLGLPGSDATIPGNLAPWSHTISKKAECRSRFEPRVRYKD
jgi:hypothetical protein